MGTLLGVVFIAAAAAAGVYVGTRPTVMDGHWIAAKLAESAGEGEEGTAVLCDRRIPISAAGATFACVHVRGERRWRVSYRMSREGELERVGARRVGPGAGAEGDDEGGGGEPGAGGAGEGGAGDVPVSD